MVVIYDDLDLPTGKVLLHLRVGTWDPISFVNCRFMSHAPAQGISDT